MKYNLRRVLMFSSGNPLGVIESLKSNGAELIVVRRHNSQSEFDFHCLHPLQMKKALEESLHIDGFHILREMPKDRFHPSSKSMDAAIRRSNELIKQERYWEVHSILEPFWRAETGTMKDYIRGIILIASAMVKYQTGHPDIASRMYDRARSVLLKSGEMSDLLEQLPVNFKYPVNFKIPELVT